MATKRAGELVKEMRIKNNLTQKELGEKIGLTQQAVALLETGKRKVDFDLFLNILDELHEPLVDATLYLDCKADKSLSEEVSMKYFSEYDKHYEGFLKAIGAIIYINENDNYTIKYCDHIIELDDYEYMRLRSDIEINIGKLIDNLYEKHQTENK